MAYDRVDHSIVLLDVRTIFHLLFDDARMKKARDNKPPSFSHSKKGVLVVLSLHHQLGNGVFGVGDHANLRLWSPSQLHRNRVKNSVAVVPQDKRIKQPSDH